MQYRVARRRSKAEQEIERMDSENDLDRENERRFLAFEAVDEHLPVQVSLFVCKCLNTCCSPSVALWFVAMAVIVKLSASATCFLIIISFL